MRARTRTLAVVSTPVVAALCLTLVLALPRQSVPVPSLGIAPAPAPAKVASLMATQNLAFTENRGQWDAQAKFLAQTPGANIWITDSGVVYDLYKIENLGFGIGDSPDHSRARRTGQVVRMEFVGGIQSPPVGVGQQAAKANYFLGNDRSAWATDVPRYSEARAERIYDGVEARYYFDQGAPRYDLVVAPGADPSRIAMRFEGTSGVTTDGKTLKLKTTLGDVEHRGLFAYQKIGGGTKQVPCGLTVEGKTVRFSVGNYDRTRPLVIDPIIWSTFFGGSVSEYAYCAVRNSSGQIYVGGATNSADFPTTAGVYDTTLAAASDATVSLFDADGNLLFSTYLGGSLDDYVRSITLDNFDNPVLLGGTSSANFPTTAGAYDSSANGGDLDVFVAKFNTAGSVLYGSTYLGTSGYDGPGRGVFVNGSDQIVLAGTTDSVAFPTTAGALDTTFNGASDLFGDTFVVMLSSGLTTLDYGTFFGGSSDDAVSNVARDSSGNIILYGQTSSTNFPVTGGSYDVTYNGGQNDAAIVVMNSTATAVSYATFLGGASTENAVALDLDSAGNFVLSGSTWSSAFPTTAGAFDTTYHGQEDIYVAKIDPTLKTLEFSTLIGTTLSDFPTEMRLDAFDKPVIFGRTGSSAFPVTAGGADKTFNGGNDLVLVKLAAGGSKLDYSTFIGGSGFDSGYAMDMDASGNCVICGGTTSTDFPVTPGAFDESHNGGVDAFVTMFNVMPTLRSASLPGKVIGGFSTPLSITLDQPANPGNTLVALSTDTPSKVFVPATTKVRPGQTTKKLAVRTESVKVDTLVHITASCNGVQKVMAITLKPGGLQNIKLGSSSLAQSTFGSGSVSLTAAAPVGGRSVALDSSRSSILYVPHLVDVEVGEVSAVFPIYAGSVVAPTPVTVTAKLGTMQKTDTITVTP